jgi:hypothetical protein
MSQSASGRAGMLYPIVKWLADADGQDLNLSHFL